MESLFTKQNIVYIIVFVFCALMYFTVFLSQDTFLWLVQEDGLLESTAALLFMITAVLFFILFFRENSFGSKEVAQFYDSRSKRIFFFLLGLLFVLLLGEEISWGQRIFGWATPEGLAELNQQNEITLHNLKWLHPSETAAGEEVQVAKSGIAALLTAKKIFVYIFVSFLFLLPFSFKYIPFIKKLAERFYVPIPAIQLGVLFIMNVFLFKAFKPFAGDYRGAMRGLGEIEEFNFAVILFLLPFVWYGRSASPKIAPTKSVEASVKERV